MTKFFSLLSSDAVQMAPGQKIVPAEEFTTLKSASELLALAEAQVEEAKVQMQKDADLAKQEGFDKGFQEGLTKLNRHILELDKELKQLREEIHQKILPLALSAAKKIVGEELALHPDRIVDIVMNALKPVTQHRKVIVYVNKVDIAPIEKARSKIRKIFEHLDSFSVQERSDIEPGGCILETEAGMINAQLENQWRALESAFKAFMKK